MEIKELSLRDYIATAALQGLIAAGYRAKGWTGKTSEVLSRTAYEYADALLKAKEVPHG